MSAPIILTRVGWCDEDGVRHVVNEHPYLIVGKPFRAWPIIERTGDPITEAGGRTWVSFGGADTAGCNIEHAVTEKVEWIAELVLLAAQKAGAR